MVEQGQLYTPIVVDHFTNPRNVGKLDDADGIGRVDDPATDNLIMLYLKLDGDRVTQARFRTLGCSSCIAASSLVTELVRDQPLAVARSLGGPALLDALGGLPPDQAYCADLVARALAEAVLSAERATG